MSHLEYPWDVLNIEPTTDKKVIKKAYAVLLKKYKPEEYPDEFQEIQGAYQYAINHYYSNNNDMENIESSSQVNEYDTNFEQQLITANEIVEKVYLTVQLTEAKRNNLENWKFLEQIHSIDEIKLKEQLSEKIFLLISEFSIDKINSCKKQLLEKNVLLYLNQLLEWETKWHDYKQKFNPIIYNAIFDSLHDGLNANIKHYYHVDFNNRFRLYFIQLCLVFSLTLFSNVIFEYYVDKTIIVLVSILFANVVIFSLIKKSESNIGYAIVNAKVVNRIGHPCSILASIIRNVIYYAQFSILFIPKVFPGTFYFWYSFIVVVFVNYMFFKFKKCAFHDFLTGTFVVVERK